jgi:hypothetical protein
MNRVFANKLAETQPVYDNEGRLHAPPIHPGMPAPTLSGPRENPQDGFPQTQMASSSTGIFGGLFNSAANGQQSSASAAAPAPAADNTAAAPESSPSHSNFFASLFEPKKPQTQPAEPQGAVLAGMNPSPRRTESAKTDAARTEPQRPEPQIAQAPKSKAKSPDASQQDASAAPATVGSTGLMRGAQPVVPAGSFDGRWAGLQ